jgi:hypothetical protein
MQPALEPEIRLATKTRARESFMVAVGIEIMGWDSG